MIYGIPSDWCEYGSFESCDDGSDNSEPIKLIVEGSTCKKCKEYAKYAQPNQSDGTFICYSCRCYKNYKLR
jgi:hypothetical protein